MLEHRQELFASADGMTISVDNTGANLLLDGYQGNSFVSAPFWVGDAHAWSLIVINSNSTAAGTFKLECSNDIERGRNNIPDIFLTDWADLWIFDRTQNAGAGKWVQTRAVSGATTVMFQEYQNTSGWVRLRYTDTSNPGAGITITAADLLKRYVG